MAELSNYDRHRLLSLKDRLDLWDIKLDGKPLSAALKSPEELLNHWQRKDFIPLSENLKLTLHALHLLLKRAAPAILNGSR